jgi:hypothetical protein
MSSIKEAILTSVRTLTGLLDVVEEQEITIAKLKELNQKTGEDLKKSVDDGLVSEKALRNEIAACQAGHQTLVEENERLTIENSACRDEIIRLNNPEESSVEVEVDPKTTK